MSIPESAAKAKPIAAPAWDQELIFRMLMQVGRRKLLVALADGKAQTGADLIYAGKGRTSATHRNTFLSSTLKNLKQMVQAGIVAEGQDSSDGRRTLYSLSPTLKVTREQGQTVIDFDFCVVRLSMDGN